MQRLRLFYFLLASLFVYTSFALAEKQKVTLGYFPNVTHAQALIGLQRGDFAKALGEEVDLQPVSFNAGPSVIEAIFAGELDIAYIGPSPTLNGYIKSGGEEVRLIAGSATNGVVIVGNAKRQIDTIEKLQGARIATPQLGNTQDIAAKYFLSRVYKYELGAGKTEIIPVANPDVETLMAKDQLDAAWAPEPWASRLIDKGLAVRIKEERELWPTGRFALTGVIARRDFQEKHSDLVENFLRAHVAITRELANDPQPFAVHINAEIERVTGKKLPSAVLESSLRNVGFSTDPEAASIEKSLAMGRELKFLADDGTTLDRLFALNFLAKVEGKPVAAEKTVAVYTKVQRRGTWWPVFSIVLAMASFGTISIVRPRSQEIPRFDLGRWKKPVIQGLFFLGLILAWEAIAAIRVFPAYLFPGPIDVARSFTHLLVEGTLILAVLQSFARMMVGYSVSVVIGVSLGVLIARSWLAKNTVGSLVMGLQSLPSICWLPFALLWVGLNERAIIVVIILGATFSIAVSTENAIRNIPPIYLRVGQTLGAKKFVLARDILLFGALPELVGGLKVGWTFAWRSLMAAELIRSDVLGVGHLLEVGRQFNDIAQMLAAILTILILGIAVDRLAFGTIERRIRLRWGLER